MNGTSRETVFVCCPRCEEQFPVALPQQRSLDTRSDEFQDRTHHKWLQKMEKFVTFFGSAFKRKRRVVVQCTPVLFCLILFIVLLSLLNDNGTSSNRRGGALDPYMLSVTFQVNPAFPAIKDFYYSYIVNPNNHSFLINPSDICDVADLIILTYIHSAPGNYKKRAIIRATYGSLTNYTGKNLRLIFVVGKPNSVAEQEVIEYESFEHGDILQGDFIDSYRNLTYKAMTAFRWVSNHCSNAKYVLKADDDVYFSITNLIELLEGPRMGSPTEPRIMCLLWYGMKVMREQGNKWYVSKEQYGDDEFPPYCSGSAYVMTMKALLLMNKAIPYTRFFWVDDFYVTGLLVHRLHITQDSIATSYVLIMDEFVRRFTNPETRDKVIFAHTSVLQNILLVWEKSLNGTAAMASDTRRWDSFLKQLYMIRPITNVTGAPVPTIVWRRMLPVEGKG